MSTCENNFTNGDSLCPYGGTDLRYEKGGKKKVNVLEMKSLRRVVGVTRMNRNEELRSRAEIESW